MKLFLLVILPTAVIALANAAFGAMLALILGPPALFITVPVAFITGALAPRPFYRRYLEDRYDL